MKQVLTDGKRRFEIERHGPPTEESSGCLAPTINKRFAPPVKSSRKPRLDELDDDPQD